MIWVICAAICATDHACFLATCKQLLFFFVQSFVTIFLFLPQLACFYNTITHREREIKPQPHALLDQPPALLDQPHALLDQPHALLDQPPALLDQPYALLDQPPALLDQPPALRDQPHALLDQPPALLDRCSNLILTLSLRYLANRTAICFSELPDMVRAARVHAAYICDVAEKTPDSPATIM
jgi:hypothetical protein